MEHCFSVHTSVQADCVWSTKKLASESQTLAVQTHFVIWHARDIGVIGISKSTNQLDYIV